MTWLKPSGEGWDDSSYYCLLTYSNNTENTPESAGKSLAHVSCATPGQQLLTPTGLFRAFCPFEGGGANATTAAVALAAVAHTRQEKKEVVTTSCNDIQEHM